MSEPEVEIHEDKPLVSPVAEARVVAHLELVLGVLVGAVALVLSPPLPAAIFWLFAVAFCGVGSVCALRHYPPPPTASISAPPPRRREPLDATRRRLALTIPWNLIVFAAAFAVSVPLDMPFMLPFTAGTVAANGLGQLGLARWLERWERTNGRHLLYEARRSWVLGGWYWHRREALRHGSLYAEPLV